MHAPLGSEPWDGGPAPLPRDPRHRPVVFYVAPRRSRFRRRPATLSVAMGFSLLLISLLTVTLVSAWAGWRVAASGPGTPGLALGPVVPQGTPAEPRGTDVGDMPVPGSAPAQAAEPVVAYGPASAGSGVTDEQTTLPPVVAESMTMPAVARGGPVAVDTGPTSKPDASATATRAAASAAPVPAAAPAPAATAPAAPAPAATAPAAAASTAAAAPTPRRTTDSPPAATPAPAAATSHSSRHCDQCSAAPTSAHPATPSTHRRAAGAQSVCPASAEPVAADRQPAEPSSPHRQHDRRYRTPEETAPVSATVGATP
jgi:hypothetical protein